MARADGADRTARRRLSPRVNPPEIDRSLRLEPDQYKPDVEEKSLIVLHHTVGGSAESTYRWWVDDVRPIGTAYIVARDGTVYEVFPPKQWAWHLGIKSEETERRSIGIELASEGALRMKPRGGGKVLYAFKLKRRLGVAATLLAEGRVVRLERPWRGFRWFDAYDEKQVNSTNRLVAYLCQMYGVACELPPTLDLVGPADVRKWIGWEGVLHHAILRPDKTDLNPSFPWERSPR